MLSNFVISLSMLSDMAHRGSLSFSVFVILCVLRANCRIFLMVHTKLIQKYSFIKKSTCLIKNIDNPITN